MMIGRKSGYCSLSREVFLIKGRMTHFLNEIGKTPSKKDWLTMFVIGKAKHLSFP